MISSEEKKVVLDFVLEKEENLKTALLIGSLYDDLRIKIISAFEEALTKELKKKLDNDWVIEGFQNPLESYARYSINKKSWNNKYRIAIEAQKSGAREFIIGVQKKPDAGEIDGLKTMLDEKIGNGKSTQWWPWYRYVDERYRNWDDKEVLFEMWFQRNSVVEHFKNQILKIKDLAASYIDKAVRENENVQYT